MLQLYSVAAAGDPAVTAAVAASNEEGVRAIDGGASFAAIITSTGSVQVLAGAGAAPAPGAPIVANVPADAKIPGSVLSMSAGGGHVLALMSDTNRVLAWGDNREGQATVPPAANGSASDGGVGCTAVAAGGRHSLALLRNGSVVAWGDSSAGATNVPPTARASVRAIAAGADHSLALLTSGSVVAWGAAGSAATTAVPAAAQAGVTAVVAGNRFSLALKMDGSVVVWGDAAAAGEAVLTLPATLAPAAVKAAGGVKALAAGSMHALALLGNGQVVAWGDNSKGQTSLPANATGAVAIAAGDFVSFVLLRKNATTDTGKRPRVVTSFTAAQELTVGAGRIWLVALDSFTSCYSWRG
jgi:alpha-tubulin suppressor-like RCC1 family protein